MRKIFLFSFVLVTLVVTMATTAKPAKSAGRCEDPLIQLASAFLQTLLDSPSAWINIHTNTAGAITGIDFIEEFTNSQTLQNANAILRRVGFQKYSEGGVTSFTYKRGAFQICPPPPPSPMPPRKEPARHPLPNAPDADWRGLLDELDRQTRPPFSLVGMQGFLIFSIGGVLLILWINRRKAFAEA